MTGASGNSARAQRRVRPTFAPWWHPWRWCWARDQHGTRCRLPRRHHGRHACWSGLFDIRYFDTPSEGTP